jgi:hypothetical protein
MRKTFEDYSRTELGYIMKEAGNRIDELRKYRDDTSTTLALPEVVEDALVAKENVYMEIVSECETALMNLTSRCVLCQKKEPVEYRTLGHICSDCDKNIMQGVPK